MQKGNIVDMGRILERYTGVEEMEEVVGVWEFFIEKCPIHLKIKVVKIMPQNRYMGIANYEIKGPNQAGGYRSLHLVDSVQEALEDALAGFLMFWDPERVEETEFELDKDFL